MGVRGLSEASLAGRLFRRDPLLFHHYTSSVLCLLRVGRTMYFAACGIVGRFAQC